MTTIVKARADIEIEMLSRYTTNKTVKTELERDKDDKDPDSKQDQPTQHEVRIKTENSVLEDDLELSLDNVELIVHTCENFENVCLCCVISLLN